MLLQSFFVGSADRAHHLHVGQPAADGAGVGWPSVAVVVPACNEGRFIAAKIQNLLALDYPRERMKVVVVCDGGDLAKANGASRQAGALGLDVTLLVQEAGRGQAAMLNDAIARCNAEFVAFTDVTAGVPQDALSRAVKHFQYAETGAAPAACEGGAEATSAERLYCAYQEAIKADAPCVYAPLGAYGAFYLFKRNVSRPRDEDASSDDPAGPMRMAADGWHAVLQQVFRLPQRAEAACALPIANATARRARDAGGVGRAHAIARLSGRF